MASNRKRSSHVEEESSYVSEEAYEECPVCRQEFAEGVCPINSAECPYQKGAEDADEDEEDSDFEDVKHLGEVLEEDKEADRLTEEEGEIPDEDLKEEDR